jgi:hypothetical protein
LTAVVAARSSSRNSGAIWWETERKNTSSPRAAARSCSLAGVCQPWRRQMATLRTPLWRRRRRRPGEVGRGGGAGDGAVGVGAFGDAVAVGGVDEEAAGGGGGGLEVGAVRTAADEEEVFEAGGGDEGGVGAFAFEQGVGGDGGAVDDFEFAAAGQEAGEDDGGGVAGVRGELEGCKAPVVVLDDEVGEGCRRRRSRFSWAARDLGEGDVFLTEALEDGFREWRSG